MGKIHRKNFAMKRIGSRIGVPLHKQATMTHDAIHPFNQYHMRLSQNRATRSSESNKRTSSGSRSSACPMLTKLHRNNNTACLRSEKSFLSSSGIQAAAIYRSSSIVSKTMDENNNGAALSLALLDSCKLTSSCANLFRFSERDRLGN